MAWYCHQDCPQPMKQKKPNPKELCNVEMNTYNKGNIAYQTFRKGHGFQITVVKGEEYLIPFHKTGYWLLLHLEKKQQITLVPQRDG